MSHTVLPPCVCIWQWQNWSSERWHGPISHHCGFSCTVVCMQAFCTCIDKCDSSPVLEGIKEKCFPGVKDHREGNLGVCSPLQLSRTPCPSETRAWCWALVPPILLQQRSCPVFPFSLPGERPWHSPFQHASPSREHQFHLDTQISAVPWWQSR